MPRHTLPKEYFFKEGCFIQELHNSSDDSDISVAHVRVEARQNTKLHALKETSEVYAVLKGQGEVTVGQLSWQVEKGSVVVIEADQAQKIRNTTDQDLVFLAICTPRFQEENYRQLED